MALQLADQLRSSLYHLDEAASKLAMVAVLDSDPRAKRVAESVRTIVNLHQMLSHLMKNDLNPDGHVTERS